MENTISRLRGSITALITPLIGGDVDYESFRALINWQIEQGTSGIVVAGTTGQHKAFNTSELRKLFNSAVETVDGRIPVIAGCGDSPAERAIELSHIAEAEGADATLHIGGKAAINNQPNADADTIHTGLTNHFTQIHAGTNLPIIMYNVPGRTGVNMRIYTIKQIAANASRVIGIKDCSDEFNRVECIKKYTRPGFVQLTGEDAQTLEYLRRGGQGCISVTSNIAPRACADLYDAVARGDAATANKIDANLQHLHEALFIEPNPQGVQYAAARMGLTQSDELRAPLHAVSRETQSAIRVAMTRNGLGALVAA